MTATFSLTVAELKGLGIWNVLPIPNGVLVGAGFPLTNIIYLQVTGSVAEVAAGLYAGALVGAWQLSLRIPYTKGQHC